MSNKVYEIITDRILELLDKGVAPWQRTWKSYCTEGGDCGAFFNLKTKKAYRGMNVFLLSAAGFASPWFASFKQIQAMGGQVNKGAKGTQVIFWMFLDEERNGEKTGRKIPLLRYYTVFNIEAQTTGLEDKLPKLTKSTEDRAEFTPVQVAQAIIDGMPKRPEISHGGNRACYSPAFDRVQLPKPESFDNAESYYSVAFHELAHATGHESRLARRGVMGSEGNWSPFGTTEYAKEELVAEMASAFLCGVTGIEHATINNTAAYLNHWREKISEDPKIVIHAASAAQKAADFIQGKIKTEEVEE